MTDSGKKKQKPGYKFFENKECQFYPCHRGVEEINCLFCFCPLYEYKDCGGNYQILKNGMKDCSSCLKPHIAKNYDPICKELQKRYKRKTT